MHRSDSKSSSNGLNLQTAIFGPFKIRKISSEEVLFPYLKSRVTQQILWLKKIYIHSKCELIKVFFLWLLN